MIRKRVDAGDPVAICCLGTQYEYGEYGLKKDVTMAVVLYERELTTILAVCMPKEQTWRRTRPRH